MCSPAAAVATALALLVLCSSPGCAAPTAPAREPEPVQGSKTGNSPPDDLKDVQESISTLKSSSPPADLTDVQNLISTLKSSPEAKDRPSSSYFSGSKDQVSTQEITYQATEDPSPKNLPPPASSNAIPMKINPEDSSSSATNRKSPTDLSSSAVLEDLTLGEVVEIFGVRQKRACGGWGRPLPIPPPCRNS